MPSTSPKTVSYSSYTYFKLTAVFTYPVLLTLNNAQINSGLTAYACTASYKWMLMYGNPGDYINFYSFSLVPYDDDDSIKDIVGVSQVAERAKCSNFEDHLQREHAGEDDVADLQNIS